MINLMVDTETMGMSASGALVGLGAVFFDERKGLGDSFYRAINLATAVRGGGTLDASTVMWWLAQSQEARNAIMFNTCAIDEVMHDFHSFVTTRARLEDVRVWGCSPSFDCEKIASAMKRAGIAIPWKYFNERCYRTIRERNKDVALDERTGLHNALDDAKFQANHLVKIHHAKSKKASA